MTKIQSLTLFAFITGMCMLHSLHAAVARFHIRSQLIQPLQIRADSENDTSARISTQGDNSIATHLSSGASQLLAICAQGACAGQSIALNDVLLSPISHNATGDHFQWQAHKQVAVNDKPGIYTADAVVSLSAA